MSRVVYWKLQLRRTLLLLSIWAIVAYGGGILFVEVLNRVSFLGLPLGFWVAQQGSIIVFVVLILAYAVLSGRADRRAGVEEDR